MKKGDEVELNVKQIQQLAQDAVLLAAAALIWVPITESRAHQAANRVSRLLLAPVPQTEEGQ